MVRRDFVLAVLLLTSGLPVLAQGQGTPSGGETWRFAVSGDSRNCGDVVMPAIAGDVLARHAEFYWHLGDLRKMSGIDEDIQHEAGNRGRSLTMAEYQEHAWDDFIANQVVPFGSTPFFVGIGNHEVIPPMTREQFIAQFADWLGSPVLREQRLADDPTDHRLKTYNHWVEHGVDFINLDNASRDQFDAAQLAWFELLVRKDSAIANVNGVLNAIALEGRALCNAVRRYGRVWQTGSWQRSVDNFHRASELVRNGRIGKILRVEVGLPSGHYDFAKTFGQWKIEPPPP